MAQRRIRRVFRSRPRDEAVPSLRKAMAARRSGAAMSWASFSSALFCCRGSESLWITRNCVDRLLERASARSGGATGTGARSSMATGTGSGVARATVFWEAGTELPFDLLTRQWITATLRIKPSANRTGTQLVRAAGCSERPFPCSASSLLSDSIIQTQGRFKVRQ
ncbi:hypothetical protein SBV1_1980009 [Verrucomicrobia bacterium]|nr:hypothetical protein SBV1_1980009 [Verrucomicrobiota bacterium]